MRCPVFILAITVVCLSCNKDNNDNPNTGEPVEIYLLRSFQTIPAKCQVDPLLSVLEDMPIVGNEDILSYSKTTYKFQLTDAALQRIKPLLDRTPFAMTVDKQVIYYGFFKQIISSSSCDHSITTDNSWTPGNKIHIKLGYPGQIQGVTIEDKRNDPVLLSALRNQGKLH